MNKLIEKDDCGNWSLKGVRWSNLMPGALTTKDTYEKVYAALWKLMEYEETDHTPTMIRDIERFAKKEHNRAMEYAIQIDEMPHWIPVSKRLPEDEKSVLVTVNGRCGNMIFDNAIEFACHYKEEGWDIEAYPEWENPDVIAWMELPEPYKTEEKR